MAIRVRAIGKSIPLPIVLPFIPAAAATGHDDTSSFNDAMIPCCHSTITATIVLCPGKPAQIGLSQIYIPYRELTIGDWL